MVKKYNYGKPLLSLNRIISVLELRYGIPTSSILGRSRTPSVAAARAHAMYICREFGGMTFVQIGEVFNRRHTTVIKACWNVRSHLSSSKKFVSEYNEVLREILGRKRL